MFMIFCKENILPVTPTSDPRTIEGLNRGYGMHPVTTTRIDNSYHATFDRWIIPILPSKYIYNCARAPRPNAERKMQAAPNDKR